MTSSRGGWRSLIARVRGKGTEERPGEKNELLDLSTSDPAEAAPLAADDDEPAAAAETEGGGEIAADPDTDDAKPAADDDAEPEPEQEQEQEQEQEDEDSTTATEAPAEGPSREERLEEEIRELRAKVARLEASLDEQSAARARMEDEVEALSDHDPLTGLASARRFGDRLSVAIIHAQRYKQKLAIVQLDIDRFGKINDRLGRSAGDDVLKSVALALESTLRQGDTIARFEGDVFTILLPGLNRDEDMTVIADKLRLALRSPFSIGGHDLHLTASLGAALFPDDGPSVESLLQRASVALKRAKARGGDSWDVHAPRSRALAAERQAREGALRRALVQNELELYWQPVVECEKGAIVGVEALLRWENPHGEAPTADFVSLAEVSGLAVPLGHWTLRAACRQGRAWHDAGHTGLVVSVNVSERQIQHPAVVKLVRKVLDETSLPPACLEIEISEAEIMSYPARTLEHLSELRKLGLRIALDGFGSGESRLGHLYRLPLDTLKIDGSVVAGATTNRDHEAVITAAVAIARSRKVRVVAEGVETEAQRVLLVRWQCDRMQGSLSGSPAPAGEVERLLLRQRKATRTPGDGGASGVRRLL